MSKKNPYFEALLEDCQVLAAYEDVSGRVHRASDEALLAVLRVLGVDIGEVGQAENVLRTRAADRQRRGFEPVHLAWDGAAMPVPLFIQQRDLNGLIRYCLDVGAQQIERGMPVEQLARAKAKHASSDVQRRLLPLPGGLPWGYHSLQVECNGKEYRSTVISAPRRAFDRRDARSRPDRPPTSPGGQKVFHTQNKAPGTRDWGCFLPLYALRTERDWGVGSFSALAQFASWIGRQGGTDCATLPLLAAFLDEPLEPSPYRPVSRLFWNELYLDVEAIPELVTFSECRQLAESDDFRHRIEAARSCELVDYAPVMQLKRRVLEAVSRRFFRDRPPRFAGFEAFLGRHPAVQDYARFRAAVERERRPWTEWPARMRNGPLTEGDYEPAAVEYHLYVQWIADEQLRALKRESETTGCGLYLDLPVGVDPRGYDTWRYPKQFIRGASVGAPPDVVFTKGQDWGLPPFDPQQIRETGYDLLRQVLANNMQFARRLRIDHVLGFHRLYCIPPGFGPDGGAYLRYRADEMYAVAILESHRHRCGLVGENLGTVPPEVDEALTEHGISGMWVAPYELEPGRRQTLVGPPRQHVAMLNTHDMPPLAAWWQSDDVASRLLLNRVDDLAAEVERQQRREAILKLGVWLRTVEPVLGDVAGPDDPARVPLRALLRCLAASPAHLLLINLEDLWLETRPQNIPGEFESQPNWRRKAQFRFEQFGELPKVLEILAEVNALRKTKEQPT